MGTRSLTIFRNYDKDVCVMYRQMDGYPSGHGIELGKFLKDFVIVNGYNTTEGKIANGIGCLAAQVIAHFKDGVGSIYIEPCGTRNMDEDYVYVVSCLAGEEPWIVIYETPYPPNPKLEFGVEIFSGRATECVEWIEGVTE